MTVQDAIVEAREKIDALTEGDGERVRLLAALAAILRVSELIAQQPKE